MVDQLNINSVRNKFYFLTHEVKKNIDVLMTPETTFDKSFPACQFLINGSVFSSILAEIEI